MCGVGNEAFKKEEGDIGLDVKQPVLKEKKTGSRRLRRKKKKKARTFPIQSVSENEKKSYNVDIKTLYLKK